MKRRKFVAATTASMMLAPWALGKSPSNQSSSNGEIYDLKTYELKFASNRKALLNYLKEVHNPYLENLGAKTMMFMGYRAH